MTSQLKPACAPSRIRNSKSTRSSCTGTPHSWSWYAMPSGVCAQAQRRSAFMSSAADGSQGRHGRRDRTAAGAGCGDRTRRRLRAGASEEGELLAREVQLGVDALGVLLLRLQQHLGRIALGAHLVEVELALVQLLADGVQLRARGASRGIRGLDLGLRLGELPADVHQLL